MKPVFAYFVMSALPHVWMLSVGLVFLFLRERFKC